MPFSFSTSTQFAFRRSHDEAAPWDDFVSACGGSHLEQTCLWGRVKQIYGWKPTWAWASRD